MESVQKTWMPYLPYSIEELQQRVDTIGRQSWSVSSLKIERLEQSRFWELEALIAGAATLTKAVLQFLVWHESGSITLPKGLVLSEAMTKTLSQLAARTRERFSFRCGAETLCNVYDNALRARIVEDTQEFIWERIYPGTCFAPLDSFLEHMCRYRFAAQEIRKVRLGSEAMEILDLGCGVGYGSKYLSTYIPEATVRGVDNDCPTIMDALAIYGTDRSFWVLDDAEALGNFESDHIVCFELVEHMENPQDLMATISRLLKKDGMAFISTPNKESLRRRNIQNPYHTKELTYKEFYSLCHDYFEVIRIGALFRSTDVAKQGCCVSNWFTYQIPEIEGFIAICSGGRHRGN